MSPFLILGGIQDTFRLFIVISMKDKLTGALGNPCRVFTIMERDLGPSPAGLKAKICTRYSVYLSRNTKLCTSDDAGTTSISSSIFLFSGISCGENVTK